MEARLVGLTIPRRPRMASASAGVAHYRESQTILRPDVRPDPSELRSPWQPTQYAHRMRMHEPQRAYLTPRHFLSKKDLASSPKSAASRPRCALICYRLVVAARHQRWSNRMMVRSKVSRQFPFAKCCTTETFRRKISNAPSWRELCLKNCALPVARVQERHAWREALDRGRHLWARCVSIEHDCCAPQSWPKQKGRRLAMRRRWCAAREHTCDARPP
jgi:hypothetical protein